MGDDYRPIKALTPKHEPEILARLAQCEATKHDDGKDEWHLLPTDALRAVGKVFTYGARKYEPHGYLKGTDWSRYYNAALRHLTAWWDRDPADPESRLSHLAHAGACCLILTVFELRGLGRDDRPPTGG